jgi:hypothetical protein
MINHLDAMTRYADATTAIAHSMGQRRAPDYLSALSLDLRRNANRRWYPKAGKPQHQV